jgi:hypothetical protein
LSSAWPVHSSRVIRMTLLDALPAAAAEITRDLAPGPADRRQPAASRVSS